MMSLLSRWAMFLLLASCSVTAGNPGSSGKGGRYTLYGTVQTLDVGSYQPSLITVFDGTGAEVGFATSTSDSTYRVAGLLPGAYVVQFGSIYKQAVLVEDDTLLNVILPLPAAPQKFRFIPLGPRDFCLLWNDVSGLEAGFRIEGPQGDLEASANKIGIRRYFPNYPYTFKGTDATEPDYSRAIENWNQAFAGSYAIHSWNEYGDSVSIPAEVPPYEAGTWDLFHPPEEPPTSQGSDDRTLCLSVVRDREGPVYIEP